MKKLPKIEKKQLVKDICDIEWSMFSEIKSMSNSDCIHNKNSFYLMRWVGHSILPVEVLNSYLDDLMKAKNENRNMMKEKYLRMENKIPPINKNSKIKLIVNIEKIWLNTFKAKHPKIIKESEEQFGHYLSCELETYSDYTLDILHKALVKANKKNINLIKERYENLFIKLGYKSIKQYEEEHITKN